MNKDIRPGIGRLAMRAEGEMWNAYYALGDTMEGAILLGSIHKGIVVRHQHHKEAFVELMKGIVHEMLKETTGADVGWTDPQDAPESERSGNG